ncbi:MAG TPA: phosphoribosylanthranilate isomerase [Ignavibacteriales bacterium]|nr:phosphoribosylanthranilate isomerase [Ignavibacteriales bacterium]
MKVKICGITNAEDALFCEALGADLLGFIFYNKSKRFIDYNSAGEIIKRLSPVTGKVGVFVNEPAEKINEIAGMLKLNFVQLHGDETPEEVSKINHPVIKSFRVKEGFDFSLLESYGSARALLDSFNIDQFGGTGKSFRWEVIPENLRQSIILAGGVSASNIGYIYSTIKPYAVDLSSSLEKSPGRKDRSKVHEFFNVLKSLKEQEK